MPATLQGLEAVEVAQLLGPSSFRRTDGPSEMLQYRNDSCVLDVFVYHDTEADSGRVRHVEARDHRLSPMAEGDCLRALIRSKGA